MTVCKKCGRNIKYDRAELVIQICKTAIIAILGFIIIKYLLYLATGN